MTIPEKIRVQRNLRLSTFLGQYLNIDSFLASSLPRLFRDVHLYTIKNSTTKEEKEYYIKKLLVNPYLILNNFDLPAFKQEIGDTKINYNKLEYITSSEEHLFCITLLYIIDTFLKSVYNKKIPLPDNLDSVISFSNTILHLLKELLKFDYYRIISEVDIDIDLSNLEINKKGYGIYYALIKNLSLKIFITKHSIFYHILDKKLKDLNKKERILIGQIFNIIILLTMIAIPDLYFLELDMENIFEQDRTVYSTFIDIYKYYTMYYSLFQNNNAKKLDEIVKVFIKDDPLFTQKSNWGIKKFSISNKFISKHINTQEREKIKQLLINSLINELEEENGTN